MARPKGQPKLGGRQKGTPNKLTGQVKEMILAALDKAGGAQYLLEQSAANPVAFMGLVGKVLPLQISGDPANPLTTIARIELVAPDSKT